MKTTIAILFSALILSIGTFAQTENNCTAKTVRIDDDGENPVVRITTVKNGKKTKEKLTGDEARDYIRKHKNKPDADVAVQTDDNSVMIYVNSETKEKLEDELREVEAEIELELEGIAKELEHLDIDSIVESVGVSISNALDNISYSYSYSSNTGESTSVTETTSGGDEEVSVRIQVNTSDDGEERTTTVEKRGISIEDQPAEDDREEVELKGLSIYPNPSTNNVQVDFEVESFTQVEATLMDMDGQAVHKNVIAGSGNQTININVSDLASGTYLLELRQGSRLTTKKLVIQ